MMRPFLCSLLFYFCCACTYGQPDAFAADFKKTKLIGKLEKKYDVKMYTRDTILRDYKNVLDGFDSLLFMCDPGTVIVIPQDSGVSLFLKVNRFENKPVVRVKQIYLSPESYNGSWEKTARVTDSLYNIIKTDINTHFTPVNKKYADDHHEDLGWFFEGIMVKEFEEPVFKAKKGDLLNIKTRFGYHIVLITEQPRPERFRAFAEVVAVQF